MAASKKNKLRSRKKRVPAAKKQKDLPSVKETKQMLDEMFRDWKNTK